jgi:hypothetical protein
MSGQEEGTDCSCVKPLTSHIDCIGFIFFSLPDSEVKKLAQAGGAI